MRLAAALRHVLRTLTAISGLLVLNSAWGATALAANAVSYQVSPATGTIAPGGTVSVLLTVQTSVPIAGGSVHVDYANSNYAQFQTAGTPELTFVYYHPEQQDVVFICNDNNCPAGTYPVGTITATAAQSGTAKLTFTPKETATPALTLIGADGASATFGITQSGPATVAPPSGSTKAKPKTNSQSTFTVPQDTPAGTSMQSQEVTAQDFLSKTGQASQAAQAPGSEDTSSSTKKWVLIGVGGGVGLVIFLWLIITAIRRWLNPGNPFGPSDPGNMIYPQ